MNLHFGIKEIYNGDKQPKIIVVGGLGKCLVWELVGLGRKEIGRFLGLYFIPETDPHKQSVQYGLNVM